MKPGTLKEEAISEPTSRVLRDAKHTLL